MRPQSRIQPTRIFLFQRVEVFLRLRTEVLVETAKVDRHGLVVSVETYVKEKQAICAIRVVRFRVQVAVRQWLERCCERVDSA